MRPPGCFSQALLSAASEPGTVRQLCERAQVGFGVGRYTASRLVSRGELEVVAMDVPPPHAGPGRPPAVLRATAVARDDDQPAPVVFVLPRSFWEWP